MPTTCLLIATTLIVLSQPRRADDASVAAAIEAGKRALLERISELDEIRYRTDKDSPKQITVRGTVTRRRGRTIVIKTRGGGTIKIKRSLIDHWVTPGHVHPEMEGPFYGGPSALVALALLSAGVETTHPTMALLLSALAEDKTTDAGTYVHSLRAGTWSALLERPIPRKRKIAYRKLLLLDMAWLRKAMRSDGAYGYTAKHGDRWDNSNTQFANLGLWAGAVAGVEVANEYWLSMADHWKRTQTANGGWAYASVHLGPTPSMTVAGCNSLYIVLDRFYANADRRYVLFKGARPRKKMRDDMRAIYRSLEAGDHFLEVKPPNIVQQHGYELFGLERLGIASGRAVIGGVDWFRHAVDTVVRHRWGSDLIADAFVLVFLVHGRAPVIFQKLEHAAQADDWNYYHRDLSSLSRYLTRTSERLYRWQRIPGDASLRDMLDAPILTLSAGGPLDLADRTSSRIRQYIDRGGTVFVHANRASKACVKSATALFEDMFRDLDRRFRPLDEKHPVYTCHFDCRTQKGHKRVPLRALSDGPRILVILCPVDIAGAWHQDLRGKHEPLFQLMANIRVYTAPPYRQLPTRLRPDPLAGPAAAYRGTLSLKRLPHSGSWNAHPGAWSRFAPGLSHRTGIDLLVEATDTALEATPRLGKPTQGHEEPRFDVIHLSARRRLRLNADTISAVRRSLEAGGLLLVDAADGRPDAIAAVREFIDALDLGTPGVLSADHPIAAGAIPGGRPLTNLETSKTGSSLRHDNDPPPILTRSLDGRIAVIACPFDLIAGIDGHFIWARSGYLPASTARIVDNIFLWQLNQRTPPPRGSRRDRKHTP